MHAAEEPVDRHLLERIDQLQLRVDRLERRIEAFDEPGDVLAQAPGTRTDLVARASDAPEDLEAQAFDAPIPEADSATVRAVATSETGPEPLLATSDALSSDASLPLAGRDEPAGDLDSGSLLSSGPVGRYAATPHSSTSGIDLAYIEERLAGRALALVGGAALILGAVFFLSLAFSRGWIGPQMQVLMGLLGGSVGLAVGSLVLVRGDRTVGHVLSAVGLAVISLSLFAATTLYELIDPALGLLAILGVAAVTTAVAVVGRSQVVAGFGLVAVLAAPPVLGASMDQLTLGYMVVVLSGVACVSLWQTWSWLPALAFVISAPQLVLWVGSGPPQEHLFVALLGYWALMAVSAGGEAFRRERPELSLASAPLLLAAGAFVIVLALLALDGTDRQVAFLLTLATFHALVAAWFVLRRGSVDPFGLLAGAYGVAIASMAVPLVLGASMTAVVWAAEAAVLAVVATHRSHGPSLIGALALAGVASARLATIALAGGPSTSVVIGSSVVISASGRPDPLVIGWLFYLVATAVFAVAVPSRTVRLTLVAVVTFTTIPILYLELEGLALVVASSAVALGALAAPRWLPWLPERSVHWRLGPALEWLRPPQPLTDAATMLAGIAAAVAGAVGVGATIALGLRHVQRPELPFSDEAGLSTLVVAATLVAAGVLFGGAAARRRGAIAALVALGIGVVIQLPMAQIVVFWAGLAAVAYGLGRVDGSGLVSFASVGTAFVAIAGVAALTLVPPQRLTVTYGGVEPHPLLVSEATLVIGAVASVLLFAAWVLPRARWSGWALAASGVAVLYLLSIATVDVFAAEAYGLTWRDRDQVEALAKEAHVALSVLWSVIGVIVTGVGLILRRAAVRVAGLAVLALATAKVFIIDLASLDIAYRVITLIVLGVLLIASAWIWNRFKPTTPADQPVVEPGVRGGGQPA